MISLTNLMLSAQTAILLSLCCTDHEDFLSAIYRISREQNCVKLSMKESPLYIKHQVRKCQSQLNYTLTVWQWSLEMVESKSRYIKEMFGPAPGCWHWNRWPGISIVISNMRTDSSQLQKETFLTHFLLFNPETSFVEFKIHKSHCSIFIGFKL